MEETHEMNNRTLRNIMYVDEKGTNLFITLASEYA